MENLRNRVGGRGAAIAASIALGWTLGVGQGNRSEVQAYDSTANGMVVVPGGGSRLYLVDTESRVILVYDKTNRSAAGLIGARSYEYDLEYARKREIGFDQKGWDFDQIRRYVLRQTGGGRKGQ